MGLEPTAAASGPPRRGLALGLFAAGVAAAAAAMEILIGAPGVPYNVRELFPEGRLDVSAAAFSLVLLFTGFAPAWAADRILRSPRYSLGAALWAACAALAAWFMLRLSVTTESLGDILGSQTLGWGWDWEFICRFLALYGGPMLLLMASSAAVGAWRKSGMFRGVQAGLGLLLFNLPCLLLVHFVVIDWANTDNLTELIRAEPYPGGVFLMLLVLLIGLNAAALAHAWRQPTAGRVAAAMAATGILVVPGWLLLELGLVPELTKYGITFPAARFLLGPDRQTVLSQWDLFLRWGIVQTAAVATLAWGELIALLLVPSYAAAPAAHTSGAAAQESRRAAGLPTRRGPAEPPAGLAGERASGLAAPGRAYGILLIAYLAFVVYGSLVPLHFQSRPFGEAVSQFLRTPYLSIFVGGRADLVANLLLFIPLTFFAMGVLTRENSRRRRWAIALCTAPAAAALSVGIEFTQLYFPARTVSLNDMLAESAGGVIGIVIWFLAGARVTCWARGLWQEHVQEERAAKILSGYAVALALYQLLPFDLTIRPSEVYHKFSDGHVNLIPLADAARLDLYGVLSDAALMAPIGYLIVLLARGRRHPLRLAAGWGLLFAAAIELLQLFVVSRYPSATDVVLGAAGAGAGGWLAMHFGPAARPGVCETPFWARHGGWIKAGLLLAWTAGIVWTKWWPLEFAWPPDGLWQGVIRSVRVPLTGLYYQSELSAAGQVAREFTAFAVMGLLARSLAGPREESARASAAVAAIAVAAAAVALEAGQLFLPAGGADMTSVILPVAGGIAGVLLYGPFVDTFVRGSPMREENTSPWSAT
ncbi:MAG: VanZ family protein [Planctomycetes bacterium]|nr:VanZ family protein [Planctomycetota bacterium]